MSLYTKKIKAGLVPISATEFVGDSGTIFYDPEVGDFYLSDGVTPGGIPLSSGGSGQGARGYTGSQGTNGYTGSQGNVGSAGATGPSGIQGSAGYTGSAGTNGTIGTTGYTGSAGPAGSNGNTGATGPIGYTGSTGANGSVGITGYTGSVGPQGEIGATGLSGNVSPTNQLINTTYDVTLDANGNTTFPTQAYIRQNSSYIRTVNGSNISNLPTVIWTGLNEFITSVKLIIQIEGNVIGDTSGWHTQSCEAIITDRYWNNTGNIDPQMTVYGIVHTSPSPMVTFTVQRNPATHLIEVVGRITNIATGTLYPKIHSIELGSRD